MDFQSNILNESYLDDFDESEIEDVYYDDTDIDLDYEENNRIASKPIEYKDYPNKIIMTYESETYISPDNLKEIHYDIYQYLQSSNFSRFFDMKDDIPYVVGQINVYAHIYRPPFDECKGEKFKQFNISINFKRFRKISFMKFHTIILDIIKIFKGYTRFKTSRSTVIGFQHLSLMSESLIISMLPLEDKLAYIYQTMCREIGYMDPCDLYGDGSVMSYKDVRPGLNVERYDLQNFDKLYRQMSVVGSHKMKDYDIDMKPDCYKIKNGVVHMYFKYSSEKEMTYLDFMNRVYESVVSFIRDELASIRTFNIHADISDMDLTDYQELKQFKFNDNKTLVGRLVALNGWRSNPEVEVRNIYDNRVRIYIRMEDD